MKERQKNTWQKRRKRERERRGENERMREKEGRSSKLPVELPTCSRQASLSSCQDGEGNKLRHARICNMRNHDCDLYCGFKLRLKVQISKQQTNCSQTRSGRCFEFNHATCKILSYAFSLRKCIFNYFTTQTHNLIIYLENGILFRANEIIQSFLFLRILNNSWLLINLNFRKNQANVN